MFNRKTQTSTIEKLRPLPYCDQIIIAILLVIIIAVPLYFDVHLHSTFDLSKITILYVLTFAILAIWSIKDIVNCMSPPEQTCRAGEQHNRAGRQARTRPTINDQNIRIQQHLRQPLILPILAFLFVTGFATAFSINPYLSLVGTYKRYGGFISTIVYISLFFIIIHFVDKKRLSALCNVIILTACLSSIYGILQHFGLDLYKWSTPFSPGIRVSATFGNPVFFAAFLIMVIPLVLIKIFSCNEWFKTYLFIGILALLLIAFYYTKTRASFLGLIISNLFFFYFIGKKVFLANKTKTVVTITIIIGISIFFNVNNKNSVVEKLIGSLTPAISDSKQPSVFKENAPSASIDTYWDVDLAHQLEGSVLIRFLIYMAGLKVIYDYPILGIGPDTLGMVYPQYIAKLHRETYKQTAFTNQNRVHNDFLDIAVSRGLPGLGIYVWLIFAYARMVWKGHKKAEMADKILIIGLSSGCLAYFVQNQFSFGHIPIITLSWFLIAMTVIACPPSGEAQHSVTHKTNLIKQTSLNKYMRFNSLTAGSFWRYTLCGIIVCLMTLLIILCLFRFKADIYFEHGRRALNKFEIKEAVRSYEMAVKYNPLALNYCNVLNGIYLKMAGTGVNGDSKETAAEQTGLFSREQTTMWFAKAINGAEQVQRLYPGDYHSAFTLGQAYHILDKISPARLPHTDRFDGQAGSGEDMSKEAFKNYKIATTSHPFKFEFRNKLARLYAEKGQHEDAIHELKEAMSIAPSNQIAYLNLAKVFMNDNERYKEAEAVLLEFIKKNPDNEIIDIYRLLSYIYAKTAKWEKVLDQSIKISQINRDDLEAHKQAAIASFKLKRYDDARKLCNRILELAGEENNTYNKYAKEMLELLSEK